MDIAVVHDILDVKGGAERVAITLAKAFDADLYTLRYDQEKTFQDAKNLNVKELTSLKIKESQIPWIYPFFHFFGLLRIKSLNLSDYDLVITSGKLGHFATCKNSIWYCHTPPRFLYDLRDFILEYLRKEHGAIARSTAPFWWKFWKTLDQHAAMNHEAIVANSDQVKERIEDSYGRSSKVVNPPIKTEKFKHRKPRDYFFSVQRPSPEKRIGLQLRIFEELENERLIMVGDYENERYNRKIRNWVERLDNVEWINSVDEEELVKLYSECKAVIQTSKDEDFGIVPVEAMASGKPVIAVSEGGFKETIIHEKTGKLIEKPYVKNFVHEIRNFDYSNFDPKNCKARAEYFSEERFVKKMEDIVKNTFKFAI